MPFCGFQQYLTAYLLKSKNHLTFLRWLERGLGGIGAPLKKHRPSLPQ